MLQGGLADEALLLGHGGRNLVRLAYANHLTALSTNLGAAFRLVSAMAFP